MYIPGQPSKQLDAVVRTDLNPILVQPLKGRDTYGERERTKKRKKMKEWEWEWGEVRWKDSWRSQYRRVRDLGSRLSAGEVCRHGESVDWSLVLPHLKKKGKYKSRETTRETESKKEKKKEKERQRERERKKERKKKEKKRKRDAIG